MLIRLTRPNGTTEEFKPSSISSVRPAIPGLYPAGTQTIIRSDGMDFAVKETQAQIDAILEKVRE
jgi:hypothetical protein